HSTPLHILLPDALGFIGSEHHGKAPWRMRQKSAPNERDAPISRWHCAKSNRKTQASFVCTSCGCAGPADVIAAGNISRRAVVSRPDYSDASGAGSARVKPPPLGVR